jgi:phospholipase/carboxylesterase
MDAARSSLYASEVPSPRRSAVVVAPRSAVSSGWAVLALSALSLVALACGSKSAPTQGTASAAAVASLSAASVSAAPPAEALTVSAKAQPATHLVVFLHGVGSNATGFSSVAGSIVDAVPHADVAVLEGLHPFEDAQSGRQWFSMHGLTDENRGARIREAGEEVSRVLDGELEKRRLGGDKLVLVGFSQGAMVSAWLAVHRSPRPAAVVLLSGRVVLSDAPASPGSGPPVFIGHGDRDRVLPVEEVEPGARTLEAWGAKVTTRVYPGLDHHVDPKELGDVRDFLRPIVEGS